MCWSLSSIVDFVSPIQTCNLAHSCRPIIPPIQIQLGFHLTLACTCCEINFQLWIFFLTHYNLFISLSFPFFFFFLKFWKYSNCNVSKKKKQIQIVKVGGTKLWGCSCESHQMCDYSSTFSAGLVFGCGARTRCLSGVFVYRKLGHKEIHEYIPNAR